MLPPSSPMMPAIFASAPGMSVISMRRRTIRPARTSPRCRIEASSRASMLPPEATRPTRPPQQRGKRRGPGALDDDLLDIEQHSDGALKRGLVGQQDVVDKCGNDRLGE